MRKRVGTKGRGREAADGANGRGDKRTARHATERARGPARRSPATERCVREATKRLKKCRKLSGPLERMDAASGIVLDVVHGGDERSWRDRRPKAVSARALAECCGLRGDWICRSVGVHRVMERRRAEGRPALRRVKAGHVVLLVALPHRLQDSLIRQVERRKKLTVAQLEAEIGRRTGREHKAGAAPARRGPSFLATVRTLDCLVRDERAFAEVPGPGKLRPYAVDVVRATL